ncbi:hypothetical protein BC829DRAFT_439422 [Chytridium lagenaria]|nr:hypothetical protein BC829DRAFT_439422 [Chytridium lagenaria]
MPYNNNNNNGSTSNSSSITSTPSLTTTSTNRMWRSASSDSLNSLSSCASSSSIDSFGSSASTSSASSSNKSVWSFSSPHPSNISSKKNAASTSLLHRAVKQSHRHQLNMQPVEITESEPTRGTKMGHVRGGASTVVPCVDLAADQNITLGPTAVVLIQSERVDEEVSLYGYDVPSEFDEEEADNCREVDVKPEGQPLLSAPNAVTVDHPGKVLIVLSPSVLIPCGHICMCQDCMSEARDVQAEVASDPSDWGEDYVSNPDDSRDVKFKCPICRKHVDNTVNFFRLRRTSLSAVIPSNAIKPLFLLK